MSLSKAAALKELFRRGEITHFFNETQKKIEDLVYKEKKRKAVALIHRRGRKSSTGVALGVKAAIQFQNSTNHYVGPTGEQVRDIATPILNRLTNQFSPDNPFRLTKSVNTLSFGLSQMLFYGANNKQEFSALGLPAKTAVLDEAGIYDDLRTMMVEVLMPAVIESDGWMLAISTPSYSPMHYFRKVVADAEQDGHLFKLTLADNPETTQAFWDECVKECGGEHTNAFRRQYMCEFVTDIDRAVIPELATNDSSPKMSLAPAACPQWFLGVSYGFYGHLAVVLATRTPDTETRLVVVDSVLVKNCTSLVASERIAELLRKHPEAEKVTAYCDAPEQFVLSLARTGLGVVRVLDKQDGLMDNVRMAVSEGGVLFTENALQVFETMKGAVWNDNRTKFSEDGDGGNFEILDAVGLALKPVVLDKLKRENKMENNLRRLGWRGEIAWKTSTGQQKTVKNLLRQHSRR